MFKYIVLLAMIAVAYAVPAGLVATPLLAKLSPQPEAPANTEHATHVAATLPLITSYAAPLAYSAPAVIAHAPLTYAAGYPFAYAEPFEAHSYRISY